MNKRLFVLLYVLTTIAFSACSVAKTSTVNQKIIAIRLKPGEDLKQSIQDLVNKNGIKAGWIVTCAGSLTNYNIRFANQPEGSTGSGFFEITSLSGTVSDNGSHLHITVADSSGMAIGGHLLNGCKIYTTAEIIIGYSDELIFAREKDGSTPWPELQIKLNNKH